MQPWFTKQVFAWVVKGFPVLTEPTLADVRLEDMTSLGTRIDRNELM
jgi:hypothetical protein